MPYNLGVDALDTILLDAWSRMSERVRRNRISALKRSRRRFKGVLTRPMREWCLVIRAADSRITAANALIDPLPRRLADAHVPLRNAIGRHEPHTLQLSGTLIRELTKPVSIPWPGVTIAEAAKRCGRDYKTMKVWLHKCARKGAFRIDHYREFRFPEHTPRSKIAEHDPVRRGGRPYVWTPVPLDPNNFEGRAPHAVWGTLWQWLWKDLPEEYQLFVQRVPSMRVRNGKDVFRGWKFICPGRLNTSGELVPCGRQCTYLYAPQTVWTLGRAIGDGSGEGFRMPEDSKLVGEWWPGLSDPVKDAAHNMRTFACKTCWKVRSACMANDNGWNEFIAQISGGLLYGRDVPRPAEICPVVRKKAEYRWRKPSLPMHAINVPSDAEAPPLKLA